MMKVASSEFCLKDVVVFVFDFPSGAAGGDDLCDMLVVDE